VTTSSAAAAELLEWAQQTLERAGVRAPDLDAVALLAHVAGVDRMTARHIGDLRESEAALFQSLVHRRVAREPLAYLTSTVSLRGIELTVGPGVFVPRRQSEPMLDRGLAEIADLVDPVVVDLCAGSAELALVIAANVATAQVVAVDASPEALACAELNATCRVAAGDQPIRILAGDVRSPTLLSELRGAVDLLIANPPYVPDGAELPTEWAEHHPRMSLYGGATGYELHAAVIQRARELLSPGGRLVLEHGDEQGPQIACELLRGGGFSSVELCEDQDDLGRFIVAVRAGRPGGRQRPSGSNEQHHALADAAHDAIRRFGVHFSSSRNRMRPPCLAALQAKLAELFDGRQTTVFTSVSSVHLRVLPLLGSGRLPSFPLALYVDDAHGTSILGPRGAGYAYGALGGDLRGTILVGSLSKAFGGAGGFVVLPDLADAGLVERAANPLVFGHSIMLPLLAATDAAADLHLSGEVEALQGVLADRIARSDDLTDHSLVGAGLLRFALSALHSDADLELAAALVEAA
jgi:release factor glutamine methyltransferase